MIVIGGSVVLASSILFLFIQEKLRELAESSWVFRKAYSSDLVKLSALGNHAGVLGAAALTAPYLFEANLDIGNIKGGGS
jgi:predicted NBD/HSP70 family sugar kinase